ncbi:SMI1/KNR4 family protein [Streptomyces sp. F-3]|uniref:SMI1/KNR4 family protein n=1 Tax=Streptomyces sp. F-3 TaxID=1840095 RepID=UPI000831BEEB|nr:SMI1/KNR4 family protein [Streptomyces sp. F-3]
MAERQMWAGVRERVAAVGARPRSTEVFGALGHGFRLEEPLTAAEPAELETQIGVRLPEDCRQFLLTVGAGGAGPAYGVLPLRRTGAGWRWEGDGADLADLSRLAGPFPVQGPDAAAVRALLDECPEEEDFGGPDGLEEFDARRESWEERWVEPMWNPDRTVGAVVICHRGCALREWLVLSGPERGRTWADARADEDGTDLVPRLDASGEPLTFARWYLDWLEAAERLVLVGDAGI